MDLRIIYSILLSLAPIAELRGGMPLAVAYSLDNNIPVIFGFLVSTLANILVVFFIFFFLDFLHARFMKMDFYSRFFKKIISKIQKKADVFEKKYNLIGFLALALFVAVPLPGTGAWTGVFISWILGLERNKSIASISVGVIFAGIIVFLSSLLALNAF
ncbi:MAG TPA: small multi-drug export protein [Candidatus Pacearchaeota archaeon]|nr:small multi-drug export protein [Candidatus Pacearchaeota archaeon]